MNFLNAIADFLRYDPKSPLLFNSGTFFLLYIFLLLIYTFIYQKKVARTLFILAFSFFFYYKSSGLYLLLLVGTAAVDFFIAILVHKAKTKRMKTFWLVLSLTTSLGLLAYFKYTNFLLFNVSAIIGNNFAFMDIFLPIGISFYTFQTLSYIIDIYRGNIDPTYDFLDYMFFISFFPHLVAGPIVKAKLFLPQLKEQVVISKEKVYTGLWLIMAGLLKKAVIADYIAQYNDIVFANPTGYSGFENLMAILGYTLQIYCDFSGYSDMAIGMARIMGFDLGVNFNFPYKAQNITDFWRRWHIALSTWLREYLYIPLGGNRKGKVRTYVNLFLTMFLGGLWHGASWKFVFWGCMHGTGLAIHKMFTEKFTKIPDYFATRFASWLVTFIFVVFLWIFFRASDINMEIAYPSTHGPEVVEATANLAVSGFQVAWLMLHQVIFNMDLNYIAPFLDVRWEWVMLVIIGFLMHSIPTPWNRKLEDYFVRVPFMAKLVVFLIIVQLVIQFKTESVQPFIYFQF